MAENNSGSGKNEFSNLLNTADHTGEFEPEDIRKNKALGIIAYLGILFFIPLVAAPESKYAKFHANQGLLLLIASAVIGVVTSVIGWIMPGFLSAISWLITTVLSLIPFALFIFGIVHSANGKAKELPLIGSIRLLS